MNELLDVANRKELAETGGGHNQKGIDFQRHWAVMRMFDLEQANTPDFLLLFETIQDIAELDSELAPTSIRIYQVKKKDRNDWSWSELTKLRKPSKSKNPKPQPLSELKDSPLGKLYASVIAFKKLKSEGRFISNVGCDLPLKDGGNAATSRPCDLSLLSDDHLKLLANGLGKLHEAGFQPPELARLGVERVTLPPDAPGTYLIGVACKFLKTRSPRHAGQAEALVDSLIAKVGPLGSKTDKCRTLDEIRRERGFAKKEFIAALAALEDMPDLLAYLDALLTQLIREGMSFMEQVAIKTDAARIFRHQLMGKPVSLQESALLLDCDNWLNANAINGSISLEHFANAYASLNSYHPTFKKSELLAHFALRVIKKCVAQT